jgi:hypothetical protein
MTCGAQRCIPSFLGVMSPGTVRGPVCNHGRARSNGSRRLGDPRRFPGPFPGHLRQQPRSWLTRPRYASRACPSRVAWRALTRVLPAGSRCNPGSSTTSTRATASSALLRCQIFQPGSIRPRCADLMRPPSDLTQRGGLLKFRLGRVRPASLSQLEPNRRYA